MARKLLFLTIFLLLVLGAAGAGFATWGYFYITRDLPKLSRIEDYRPSAVTRVLANDGTLIGEFFNQRRYPVKLDQIPELVRNAFIAAEDASFYSHKGVDPVSILRALWKNISTGSARQGGSTITQQVVKNLLLTPEKNIERKVKEAILSYRLENRFSKDEILEMYLNQIFFGNTAYGIRAAARLYFRKEPAELTLAEAAMLAGLPKAPSRYSPLASMARAKRRQRYVLEQMVRANFVTREEADAALRDEVRAYPADLKNLYAAPYYLAEVRRILLENPRFRTLDIDNDGLEIHTALDLNADRFATAAVQKALREVDKRRGWRGPIAHIEQASLDEFRSRFRNSLPRRLATNEVYPALVTRTAQGKISIDVGGIEASLAEPDIRWARKRLSNDGRVSWIRPEQVLKPGDVIEVSAVSLEKPSPESPTFLSGISEPLAPGTPFKFVLDQTPEVEGSLAAIDPHSGRVIAAIGGYSYQRSKFNRVTQSLRQPGSAFKPVVYLAAVDGFNYTPATIVYDQPRTFRAGDDLWTPGNFDEKFLGPITLRTALERSRNLVSADIISNIGVDAAIRYARALGIESPLGRNLSLSLGSSEVTMLELVRAYGVFAAKGVLFQSVFITKIIDRDGKVVYDHDAERLAHARQAIPETSAFIMANMLKGVVDHGTGYRIKQLKRPAAGKTGTSNDQMDAWFVGFTPGWACGAWVGFDQKRTIGEKETGGVAAAPMFLYFMHDWLQHLDQVQYARLVDEAKEEAARLGIEYVAPEPLPPLDFSVPEGVEPFWVDKTTGYLSDAGNPNAILEYFVQGTEPSKSELVEDSSSYLESPEL